MNWDIFISYASEDKQLASELADALKDQNLRVWYDTTELKLGDSLRNQINEGLENSRFALVILSPSFLSKEWPRRELDALVSREVQGERNLILPLYHNVSTNDIASFSPKLADRVALNSVTPIGELARAIRNAIVHEQPISVATPPDDRKLSVLIDPGDASEELLTEFYAALSAYYRAVGGSGLSIKKDQRRSLVGEMV